MNESLLPEILAVMPAANLTGLFVSFASFYQPVAAQGPTGNMQGTFAPVAGLQNIPCVDAPESITRIQATEIREVAEIMSKGMRHVLLNGFFAVLFNAAALGWQVTIDGILYDLLGAESDSQETQTRLDLQLAVI